ncbi:5-bromo-4-chloroindolyl phosphate hydrolysis family protein [Roseovarius sp. MMSF_3281]|uniref:5-bromo-4-chloroindolyl phosphate hydrolysis family protein n=1 Tax=Roseovarius sp. MMSF_3281 TaxID=3046694 RepID=UPI00273DAD2D|nr:5-bromo-4-chloroindolyl phosphate hydrolysis family protein [Roseovarius sp. MMSF_3281]
MAQRYGGKYSPDGGQGGPAPVDRGSFQGAKRTKAGGRVNLLFLAPLPLIFKAFTSEPIDMAMYLAALGLLILAAWLTREGILAQEAYEARKVARRPALPRKIVGSLATGLGLGIAGFAGFGALEAVIFAALGAVIHSFAFGLDPLKDKGAEGVDMFQTDRVARAVDEAEKHLVAMSEAIKRAGDRQLEGRVERFKSTARDLFRTVEEDPRDLTAARKYLSVYLLGAKDATVKFADIYSRNRDSAARQDYLTLLDDLEGNFAARTEKLLLDDRSDLTIEIDVLRDRLQREGIRPDSNNE